jgi:acetyl esterase
MPLHPECKAFLDQLAAAGGRPVQDLSPDEARQRVFPPDLAGPEQRVYRVEDRQIPLPHATIAVRRYTPSAGGSLPALIYFHGGGFVLGNLDTADRTCRALANASGCVVVSVDYRLAPEHPFPGPIEDAYGVTRYIAEHADAFGIDSDAIGVGGDSAGANLAAVTTLRARDGGGPRLAFQLLVYPWIDLADDSPSIREYGDDHFLTADAMNYFTRHYLRGADPKHPHVSPLRAGSLAGLPPAFVITAECDPLRDQGEHYAAALRAAGVVVEQKRYEGMIHPFVSLAGIIGGARTAIADAAAAMRAGLAAPVSRTVS